MSIDSARALLQNPTVRAELRRAWEESFPGEAGGHEEGGFICRDVDGNLTIDRWPVGAQDRIVVPPHPDGRRNGEEIVATFHTHPNSGYDYRQEPSEMDRRIVREDSDLKAPGYLGELVISSEIAYWIYPTGITEVVCGSRDILKQEGTA